MQEITVQLPDMEGTPLPELIEFYDAQLEKLKTIQNWYYGVRRYIQAELREEGAVAVLTDGRKATVTGSTWEYPDEIAEEYPALASFILETTFPTENDRNRASELITEEFTGKKIKLVEKVKVDGRAVRKAIDNGGPAAVRLLQLRTRKNPELVIQ